MPPREDESNQPVKCGYCNKELKFKKNLRHHIDSVHGKGLPERKAIVSNEKQTNLLTFCTKKPRLDVSSTEDSSVAHTSQTNDQEIISEDHLFSIEKNEDKSNISKELSDNTGILIEMRRNHKIVLEKLDKIERNTKLNETNEERSKKTKIQVRKQREIPEDQDIGRAMGQKTMGVRRTYGERDIRQPSDQNREERPQVLPDHSIHQRREPR